MKRLLWVAATAFFIYLPASAQNIAVVNGKPIPSSRLDSFIELLKKQGQTDGPELRARIKEELINREVFMQNAEKQGIAKKPEVSAEIELMRQSIIIRGLFTDFLEKNKITDADIQAEYDRYKKAQGEKEYRARHILVEKEDEAKAIISQIKAGSKFEDLAKEKSKDPGSAKNGGDLDWASSATYVKPFADALNKLQKGQMTDTPVQTQFGWHIVRLDDIREAQYAPLAELKPQIEESLRREKLQKFQQEMLDKAKPNIK